MVNFFKVMQIRNNSTLENARGVAGCVTIQPIRKLMAFVVPVAGISELDAGLGWVQRLDWDPTVG